jgi:GntR family transcriptional regulator
MQRSLHFHLDHRSGLPVYRQLMDQIKYYVAAGTLQVGDQLPSIRELAQTLVVNPTTIVKAYGELEHEGVIDMRQGKGAFVGNGGVGLPLAEREEVLRRLARQLAVEASQLGADREWLVRLVLEEIDDLQAERTEGAAAVKLRVVRGT